MTKPTPPPVAVIIAIDTSGSMSGSPAREAAKAAQAFVDALELSHFSVGVMAFADRCGWICKPSKDANQIQSAINQFESFVRSSKVGGGNATDPFDEIRTQLTRNEFANHIKYAVVLADGVWGYQTVATAAAKKCHQVGIEVVALGFGGADRKFLQSIASKKEYSKFTSLHELITTFREFARQITSDSISRGR
jgi:uncharacterized protein with von Willebrand factor type A (vWA) domain